jgi:tubulin--tyrosine ligase-like protein 12
MSWSKIRSLLFKKNSQVKKYFVNSFNFADTVKKFDKSRKKAVKIFSNYPYLKQSQLNPELFSLTESLNEAEYLFSNRHPSLLCSSPEELEMLMSKPRNSFDSEFHFVRKDFLNMNVQKYWGHTSWWPLSFDMSDQLSELAGEYLYRKYYSKQNNLWLIKPSNMAHSSNMILSDSLNLVLKNAEHIKGINENAIASKYIERCLTFRKCKFDMRWVVVVNNFEPLEVYVYKHFWLRVSKNDYTRDKRR